VSLGDMTTPPVCLSVFCKRLQFSLMASSEFEKPNVSAQPLPEAEARHEWTL
jgi:hypothetical protein